MNESAELNKKELLQWIEDMEDENYLQSYYK